MPTEEQTEHNTGLKMYSTNAPYVGQRLVISDREVAKLGFWLSKLGSPAGDVSLRILKVSDDGGVILSKVWGDAGDLSTEPIYKEVTFDTPATINEEVRIAVHHIGGSISHCVKVDAQNSDVKADEWLTRGGPGSWSDVGTYDFAYIYTYEEPAVGWMGKISGVTNPAKIMGVDVADIAKVHGVA